MRRGLALLVAAGLLLGSAGAGGSDGSGVVAPDPSLSGREIYARVLANRFDTFRQESSLASGDRAGRVQRTDLEMLFKDFRNIEDLPERGVLSKTLVKYTHPFDLRHAGYLVIQNHARANDQFVYFPARRQTVRVNLRGEAVFGTDFSFEDVIPRELEDATYRRQDDTERSGLPVYVVEAVPTEQFDSEYSKFLFYVDPATFVPLWTRYWDRSAVEIKQLSVDPADVEQVAGVYVPMKLTMRHLQLESFTTLQVTNFVPNPPLPQSTFEIRRLESH
ncbi:MAG: outer membrane lipoprotein-sorting protein [Myxococcota bacterium]